MICRTPATQSGHCRHNRQKCAAKQKARRRASPQHDHRGPEPGHDRIVLLDHLVAALYASANCPDHNAEFHSAELIQEFSGWTRDLDTAADVAMAGAVARAWEAGWSPSDLHELVRRHLDASATDYLAEAIVRESAQYAIATLHPRWRADLNALSAGIGPIARGPQMWEWADRHSLSHRAALAVVLNLLRLLGRLPVLEPLLPLPGASRHAAVVVGEADAKALGRVRGLLAKAEATRFPEEAEALSAKAQELMSRYSLHHAINNHEAGRTAEAAARRLWIDNPYAGAKATLVQAVATANRCRVVWAEKLGFVTIVGADADLESVELLTTSLLVQANRAMLAAGRQNASGQARTRSFRQSFLVSYGLRIGERLTVASSAAAADVDHDSCYRSWRRAARRPTTCSTDSSRPPSPVRCRRQTPPGWRPGASLPTLPSWMSADRLPASKHWTSEFLGVECLHQRWPSAVLPPDLGHEDREIGTASALFVQLGHGGQHRGNIGIDLGVGIPQIVRQLRAVQVGCGDGSSVGAALRQFFPGPARPVAISGLPRSLDIVLTQTQLHQHCTLSVPIGGKLPGMVQRPGALGIGPIDVRGEVQQRAVGAHRRLALKVGTQDTNRVFGAP